MDLVLDSDRKQLKLLPGADSGRYIKGVLNYRNTSPSRSPPSITRNPPWSTPPPSCFQCVRCPSVLWVARLLWYQELLPITLCLSQAKTAVSIHFFGAILSLTRYVISLHDHASVSASFIDRSPRLSSHVFPFKAMHTPTSVIPNTQEGRKHTAVRDQHCYSYVTPF